ncbi:hypothetical protein F0726_02606 [Acidithiobacillus caldus]|nr:hypothetical protein F0726_02606 [Acidithiobacillus caldus]
MYRDKEGQTKGTLFVENKAQGVSEKYPVEYVEKTSEKTHEKYLSAKADRENGKALYATIQVHEKDGERWLSAHFAEKAQGKVLENIEGAGGRLKSNQALLDAADKDRTAQYVREKFKVEPAQLAQEKGKDKGRGIER